MYVFACNYLGGQVVEMLADSVVSKGHVDLLRPELLALTEEAQEVRLVLIVLEEGEQAGAEAK